MQDFLLTTFWLRKKNKQKSKISLKKWYEKMFYFIIWDFSKTCDCILFWVWVLSVPLLIYRFRHLCGFSDSFVAVIQSLSLVWLFGTPWPAARQASLSFSISQSSPKPMSIESVMPSNHLSLCRPLLLLPSICPSIRLFANELALCLKWPKYWSFSFSISPSNEYSGLISFRMDWFDLLAVPGTLKSLLQQHSSKGSIIWCSAFIPVFLPFRIPWRVEPVVYSP